MQIHNIAKGEIENKVSGVLTFDQFREAFDSLNNDNAGLAALAEKVFNTAAKIDGLKFRVVGQGAMSGHNVAAHYVPGRNIIELNGDYFNSMRVKDIDKASTILHELIPITSYHVHGKKQWTGMVAAPITINGERRICVVEVIDNKEKKRQYVHEA